MFSPFRARSPEEPGSGGKAPRLRRRAAPVSPYAQSENLQPSPPRQAGNPRWLTGIVAGAGRLLSSVFRSESGESSSSYSSESDGGSSDSSDEDENAQACAAEFHELDKNGRSKSCTTHGKESQSIIERNERRLAIEKWLLQETFSRVEGDRLIKIVESRVVNTMETGDMSWQKDLPDKTVHSDVTLTGTLGSRKRGGKFPEGLAYFANHQSDLSPGISILHTYSHDLCDKAIMEAKKWLEKKKMESNSKAELEGGPCTLNSEDLQYHMEGEMGSPVDIAKSYMRERPPWQSPTLSSIGFKTPPMGMHLFEDETQYAIRAHSFSTSKELKRGYLAADFDDTRSVHMKSVENPPECTVFHQVGSSNGLSEHEAQQTTVERNIVVTGTDNDPISLPATETSVAGMPEKLAIFLNSSNDRAVQVDHFKFLPSSEMTKLLDSSASLAAKVAVGALKVNCSTNYEVNAETEKTKDACNLVSTYFILDAEDNVNEVCMNPEMSMQAVSPPNKDTRLESPSSVSDRPDMGSEANKDFSFGPGSTDVLIIETSQDVEASPEMVKQATKLLASDEFGSQETPVNYNDTRDAAENVEPEGLVSDGVESPLSGNCNRPSNGSNVHASGVHRDPISTEIKQDHKTLQSESMSAFEVMETPVDMELTDGKDHFEEEAISATTHTPNGELSLQPGSASNPYAVYLKRGSHRLPASSNGHPAGALPAESCQLSTEASIDAPADHGTSSIPRKPQKGTTIKSIERMLAENSLHSRRGRGRKVAAKPRRGRGRGRGR